MPPKSAAWAVRFTNAIRKSDGVGDLHMEGEIDRLKTEERPGWTFHHFGGCLKYSSYPASMNESQRMSNKNKLFNVRIKKKLCSDLES